MTEIADIHNHILYGVDDGADSINTSINILKLEYEQGVRHIIVTPHFHIGECMPDVNVIKENFEALCKRAQEEFPDLKLYLGNEILACNDAVRMLQDGRLFSLAGSDYVLVEFFPTVRYSEMESRLRDFLNGGYIPIVAHCERYKCLRKSIGTIDKEKISHLIEMGAYMQVNAISVYEREKKFVQKLIENDFLHFIGTDAHSTGIRGVYWKECIKYLKKKYNEQYIQWILVENPKKIINNEYIN